MFYNLWRFHNFPWGQPICLNLWYERDGGQKYPCDKRPHKPPHSLVNKRFTGTPHHPDYEKPKLIHRKLEVSGQKHGRHQGRKPEKSATIALLYPCVSKK